MAPSCRMVPPRQAEPRDLNVLPEYASVPPSMRDPRTLDKLYDGVNDTYDDDHMWLAPLTRASGGALNAALPTITETDMPEGGDRSALGVAKAARAELASHASSPNTLFVFFDEPVALSKVCFWNYSKTPARGARHQ